MTTLIRYIKFLLSGPSGFSDCKMVLIVRTDVVMGKGKVAAQCAHAAVECFRKGLSNKALRKLSNTWLLGGQPKIVLKLSSEKEILSLAEKAKNVGLITAVIRDAGRTQVSPGTISVVGIGPGPTKLIDTVTSNLRLL